ncbi:MAG: DUF898 family protein [Pseudomonadota bacterium]
MTDDVEGPRAWDLDQYSVQARRQRREARRAEIAEAAAAGEVPTDLDEAYQTDDDDGDWLAPAEEKKRPRFVLSGSIFWIALTGAVLTVLTLGFYRFWMITNLRRAYAGSVRFDGDPLEYTGTGFEKLIGFLIAISMLAVYLALANIGLVFAGLSTLDEGALIAPFSLLAVAPFYFWAQYRGQRYLLARLRWRGIRFGLANGSWSYMLRSLLWSALTVASLGFLYPFQHFRQARFIANRTYFGSLKMEQGGSWLGLLAYWIWLYIAAGMIFLAAWGLAEEMQLGEQGIGIMLSIFMPIAILILFILYMNYQVGAFRYLWDNRKIAKATLENDVSAKAIVWTYIKGSFIVSILTTVIGAIVGVIFIGGGAFLTAALLGGQEAAQGILREDLEALLQENAVPTADLLLNALPLVVGIAVTYFMLFALSFSFTQSMITQPILRAKVEAMLVRNPAALNRAQQRERDDAVEAGGFADALNVDVGGGI